MVEKQDGKSVNSLKSIFEQNIQSNELKPKPKPAPKKLDNPWAKADDTKLKEEARPFDNIKDTAAPARGPAKTLSGPAWA